ncbi:MAG: dTDP-4-dehydrorhamnose 3,5-epimerase [Bacteroidetes bacterium]|nr:dTDP-4-dehydrorhamnose 3,5-epimerase [Bacteroidota bacterium]
MDFRSTKLPGCVICIPTVHRDARGYFFESFRSSWQTHLPGCTGNFVQDNQSLSHYGTIRGLHFQLGEHAQGKLVRVISGKILDVIVDLRTESPTYGQYISVELSSENHYLLWIPKGFAHGFSVLSETAEVSYKCDAYYNKEAESGIHPLDQKLDIDWRIPKSDQILSEKDNVLPRFKAVKK